MQCGIALVEPSGERPGSSANCQDLLQVVVNVRITLITEDVHSAGYDVPYPNGEVKFPFFFNTCQPVVFYKYNK
jgi:hypothetical protein